MNSRPLACSSAFPRIAALWFKLPHRFWALIMCFKRMVEVRQAFAIPANNGTQTMPQLTSLSLPKHTIKALPFSSCMKRMSIGCIWGSLLDWCHQRPEATWRVNARVSHANLSLVAASSAAIEKGRGMKTKTRCELLGIFMS